MRSPWAPAVAQGPVAVGDNCFAVATRFDRSIHNRSGTSLQQAEADALSKCRANAYYPLTCRIVTSRCNAAQKPEAISYQRWIDGLRQKSISVNLGVRISCRRHSPALDMAYRQPKDASAAGKSRPWLRRTRHSNRPRLSARQRRRDRAAGTSDLRPAARIGGSCREGWF
jgi:hypothetical protein